MSENMSFGSDGGEEEKSLMVTTPEARLDFAQFLFQKRERKAGAKPRYECTIIFKPGEDLSKLKAAAAECAKREWGGKCAKMSIKAPFLDAGKRLEYDGYEDGAFFLRLSTTSAFKMIDGALNEITDPDELYSGCWVIAAIEPYAYNQDGNVGVSFGLRALQRVKKDEKIGSGGGAPVEVENIFSVIEEPNQASADSVFG